ncbi:hypothetical protein TrRE_jg5817 [Triparma retinervis]|uniref:RING-type domain-containing protein n=1 Tax=Triparma retinervis TaxID=2557542 RepID=A0A9W7A573_9STRA|nr:hypothetical protein TrRE_jg5817 [Triparma retinervis]
MESQSEAQHWKASHKAECKKRFEPQPLPNCLASEDRTTALVEWRSKHVLQPTPPCLETFVPLPPSPLLLPGCESDAAGVRHHNDSKCDAMACILALVQAVPQLQSAMTGTRLGRTLDELKSCVKFEEGKEFDAAAARLGDGYDFHMMLMSLFDVSFPLVKVAPTETNDCPVCCEGLDVVSDLIRDLPKQSKILTPLQCGHVLHTMCFREMIGAGVTKCPICQKEIMVRVETRVRIPASSCQASPSFDFICESTAGLYYTTVLKPPPGKCAGDFMTTSLGLSLDSGLIKGPPHSTSLNDVLASTLRDRRVKGYEHVCFAPVRLDAMAGCSVCGIDTFGRVIPSNSCMLTISSRTFTDLEEGLVHGIDTACNGCIRGHRLDGWSYTAVGDNWFQSEKSEILNAPWRRSFFLSLPPFLPISIVRYSFKDFDFSEVSFPVVGLDLAPMLPCMPPEGACTLYDLRFMAKYGAVCLGKSSISGTIAVPAPGGRYMGYAKATDEKWYEYDVCSETRRAPAMDAARRISSKYAISLVYVRRDVLEGS